jgi:protein-disulfide isomerase
MRPAERPPKGEAGPFQLVHGWRVAFLVLCTVGVCLTADLVRLHVNVHTDPNYQSYCAMSERVNCETVAASPYAVFLGLPLGVWGLLVYLALGALAISGLRSRPRVATWPFGILFWASLGASLLSVVLYYVSHFVVESICIVCTGVYLTNGGLLLVAALELRRSGARGAGALRDDLRAIAAAPLGAVVAIAVAASALGALWTAMPRYWEIDLATGPGGLTVGRTADGAPWIGAQEPRVEIVEFSDYQCPHCQRGHGEMRALVQEHPRTVRLVHRSYPLDQACNPAVTQPFHPWACFYARVAHCAAKQGRFWEANDYLFANGRRGSQVTAEEVAAAVGLERGALEACVQGDDVTRSIREDLEAGGRIGVRGTPTFLMDGRTYPGKIPQDLLDAALKRASAD